MHKVTLILHVHSCFAGASSDDVWMEKRFKLPFAPTVGLQLLDGYSGEDKIEELYYDVAKGEFKAYVTPDKELYHAGLKSECPLSTNFKERLEEIVSEYEKSGWKRRKL